MYLGDYATGATVRIPWNTNGANGASITRSANGTFKIWKDSSNVERTSANGITDNEDWDGNTGIHLTTIDLSDNTDAGFYAAGHDYHCAYVSQTIDSQTVSAFICAFSIQNRYGQTPPTAASIADTVLQRASSNWEASADPKSLGTMVMMFTHLVSESGGTVTIKRSNGTTTHATLTITTDAAADPITAHSATS